MQGVFVSVISRVIQAVRSAWLIAFPTPPDSPNTPPTVAKAAALRDGAVLSEDVDAVSKKQVA
jgi:hypothetical protein